jgi:hypothetical protein
MHFRSLYPAFKDARTIPATPCGLTGFPSDHHNLDRGGRSDYYASTLMQELFWEIWG